MRKTLLLAGITAWALVLVLIITVAATILWRSEQPQNGDSVLLKEEQVALPETARLIIDTTATDIELFASEGEQLRLKQYGSGQANNEKRFTVTKNGDNVTVRIRQRLRFSLGWQQRDRLEVELPQAWLGNIEVEASAGRLRLNDAFTWQDASLACSSGSIVIGRELTAANLRMDTNSGNIRALAALNVAEKLSIDGSSGSIHLDKPVYAGELYGNINSGEIRLAEAVVQSFTLSASSGGIRAAKLSGAGSARVNSGTIDIGFLKPLGNVDLRASSGKILFAVPEDLAFNFEGRCSSGSVDADFPLMKDEQGRRFTGSVGANPTINISAGVNSGSIHIDRQ